MPMNNYYSGLKGFTPPGQELSEDYAQRYQQVSDAIARIVSGEKIPGVTRKMAQQLMQYVTPNVIAGFSDRGYEVDPNWYMNYIQPGRVSAQDYQNILNYAMGYGGAGIPEDLATRGLSVLDDRVYQPAGYLPTHQQQQLMDQETRMRMGLQGMTFNPYTGEWVEDPQTGWNMVSSLAQDYNIAPNLLELMFSEMVNRFGEENLMANAGTTTGGVPTSPTPGTKGLTFPLARIDQPVLFGPITQQGPSSVTEGVGTSSGGDMHWQDTMWTAAEIVNAANQLGWDPNAVVEAKDMIEELIDAGFDEYKLDRELQTRFNIPLRMFTDLNVPWWHRMFAKIGLGARQVPR